MLRLASAAASLCLVLAAVPPQAAEASVAPGVGPQPGRIGTTAFMAPSGTMGWSTIGLGLYEVWWAESDHLTLTATSALPVGFAGAAPGVRVGWEVAEDLHLAASLDAGGSATLTWGQPSLYLNISTHAYVATHPPDGFFGWMALPTVGFGSSLTDFAQLHLDLGPAVHGTLSGLQGAAELWVIHYGVRFHGDGFFADIAFTIPASRGWWTLAPFIPLGAPMLSLGWAR